MMSSVFSFKTKLSFLSLVLSVSYIACPAVNADMLETSLYEYKISQENPTAQNELLLLSIQQVDGHSYIVHFEKLKQHTKPQDEKGPISLKTSRKAIKEALMLEKAKNLSRYDAEQE